MRGMIPPSGGKIGVAEIAAGLAAMCASHDEPLRLDVIEGAVLGVSSGRAALTAILQAMSRLRPGRDIVLVPAYTCYSVAAAVVRAGLKIQLVDVEPATLAMDPQRLERECDENVLAVVHTELFGAIGPMHRYVSIARKSGAYLVEDSAQAYGSTLDGQMAGTLGDVGVFSVGRGKPIRGIAGGIIVPRQNELATEIRKVLAEWSTDGPWKQMLDVAKLCAYRMCFHPISYRLLEGIPALKIGLTEYDPHFQTRCLASSQSRIAEAAARRSLRERQERREKVQSVTNPRGRETTFEFPGCAESEAGSVPRLPVLAPDTDARDKAVAAMRARGIGASVMYPLALCCLRELVPHRVAADAHCAGAEDLARRLFTIPVHGLAGPREIARMRDVLYASTANAAERQDG